MNSELFERVRRLVVNSLLFGLAAAVGVVVATKDPISAALLIAAVIAGVRAILGALAMLLGFVTPGNALVVNMLLAAVGTFAGALSAGAALDKAALVAAGYAAVRAALGLLTGIADNPAEARAA